MRAQALRSVAGLLSALALAVGCSTSSASLTPASSTTTPAASISAPTRAPTAGPNLSPAAIATPRHVASQMPGADLVGKAAMTAVDDVRVRSQPRVSDDSAKEEPLLPRGTALLVLDGPVVGSGYDWYYVAPLSSRVLPTGWVASTSRDGVPWIAAGAFKCPPVPADLHSLTGLPEGVGLACFARVPITVRARVISCECDVDGAWFTPSWFHLNDDPDLLVDPGVIRVPADTDDWFGLNLDPAGQHPDVLPVGQVVEVTGMFDHPAAATCTRTEMDGEPTASQGCRLEFAVTKLVVEP